VLAREHRDHSLVFHELIQRLDDDPPRYRRRRYAALVPNLAVHTTAESLLIHPLMVAATATGEATQRTREREIGSLRARLAEAGAALEDPDCLRAALSAASREAAAHADREELEVFVHARHAATPRQLRRLGRLHAALRQQLPTRYQREGSAPDEPWADERLYDMIRGWYAESLAGEHLVSADEEPGLHPDQQKHQTVDLTEARGRSRGPRS